MKKRPFTLVAGILGIVFLSLFVIDVVLVLAAEDVFNASGGFSFTILMRYFIPALLSIVAIIIHACLLNAFSASPEKYKAKRGKIVASIVLNLIVALFVIVNLTCPSVEASITTTSNIVINVLVLVGIALATVFFLTDLFLEKRRVEGSAASETTSKQ